jgi:GTPase SAR1 family protein
MPTNPFSNSRVDNPFQDHIDLDSLNHQQFAQLEAILKDIKNDHNHQTKGTVIIGEAGSGKTHLIMRLAKTHLKSNRLLFIRCPTNPEGVTYHIYSRILESLMEKVDDRYNQLDYLIAKSFGNILKLLVQTNKIQYSEAVKNIISIIEQNPLDIFEKFGREGTEQNRSNWAKVENIFVKWLDDQNHSSSIFIILKAFIKQTRYKDLKYKELIKYYLYLHELDENNLKLLGLSNLLKEENREELALKAIETLAHLSLMDEPLIIVFDQLEALGESYNHEILSNFGSTLREIFTHIPNSLVILNLFQERWEYFKKNLDQSIIERVGQSEIILEKPNQIILKKIIEKRAQETYFNISVFQKEDWDKILTQTTIRSCLNLAANYYRFRVENIPLPVEFKSFEEEMREELVTLKSRIFNLEQQFLVQIPESKNVEQPQIIQIPIMLEKPKSVSRKNLKLDLEKALQDYLIHHQTILEQNYDKPTIIDDNDDIGKLRLILENFREISDFDLDIARLGKSVLPANIEIHAKQWVVVIGFLQVSGTYFTNRIKHFNELVINNKDIYFRLYRDSRQPTITGKVGKEEIEKLNNSKKGNFIFLEKDQRIQLELFYQLISDIINKDQEFPLKETLEFLKTYYKDHFLMKILFGTRRSF